MHSNIYAKVAPLLRETPPNCDLTKLESFLNFYKPGMFIYPSAMQRNLGINIIEVYKILELCVEVGFLEQALEVYCPRCQRFSGSKFSSIFDIPDEVFCVHCDEMVERPIQHAIVIYRVL